MSSGRIAITPLLAAQLFGDAKAPTDAARDVVVDLVGRIGYVESGSAPNTTSAETTAFRHPDGGEVILGPSRRRSTPSGFVFISYSSTDRSYVESLFQRLGANGIPAWFDYQMVAGDKFDTVIQTQIDACRAMILVLSQASVTSEWVRREVSYAVAGNKVILPLLIERVRLPMIVANLHHEDAVGSKPPTDQFVARLKSLVA